MGVKTRVSIMLLVLSGAGLTGIAVHEDYRAKAYDDGVGVQTVGFGTTQHPDGKPVKAGDTTTPPRALIALHQHTERDQVRMRRCIGDVPLYQHEWDAYTSLTYNIGWPAFCRSTLVKHLKYTLTPTLSQGEREAAYAVACGEIMRWDKAGGRVMAGLTKRRVAEYQMCMGATP